MARGPRRGGPGRARSGRRGPRGAGSRDRTEAADARAPARRPRGARAPPIAARGNRGPRDSRRPSTSTSAAKAARRKIAPSSARSALVRGRAVPRVAVGEEPDLRRGAGERDLPACSNLARCQHRPRGDRGAGAAEDDVGTRRHEQARVKQKRAQRVGRPLAERTFEARDAREEMKRVPVGMEIPGHPEERSARHDRGRPRARMRFAPCARVPRARSPAPPRRATARSVRDTRPAARRRSRGARGARGSRCTQRHRCARGGARGERFGDRRRAEPHAPRPTASRRRSRERTRPRRAGAPQARGRGRSAATLASAMLAARATARRTPEDRHQRAERPERKGQPARAARIEVRPMRKRLRDGHAREVVIPRRDRSRARARARTPPHTHRRREAQRFSPPPGA